jgi:crossover junction endodeoxyribonuclease RusA
MAPKRLNCALDYVERIRSDVEREVTFFVAGTPVPQGSKNSFVVKNKRARPGAVGAAKYRAVMYEQEKMLKPWRSMIKTVAEKNKPEDWSSNGFFGTYAVFFFPRPRFHFGANGLRPKYENEIYKKTAPDGDKCLRAVNDALTGTLFGDDAAVIPGFALTLWAEPYLPGALISIVKLNGRPNFMLDSKAAAM